MTQEQKLSAVLSEFARTLVTDFPIQGILDRLVERIVDVLPVTSAGVTLISPGNDPHYVAASNEAARQFELLQTSTNEGPCVAAYRTGSSVSMPDLRNDTRFPAFSRAATSAGLAAVFTFPLRHHAGRLGALDLYRDTPGDLEPDAMAAAQTLADVTAAYLLNAQSRQMARQTADGLRASALHDPLTGLPNRVLLQQRLEHAAERARRTHSHAAVLFADLDGFKRVNDTYGHPTGDALLIAVARRLTTLLRPGDTLARVSGDEYVILCEDLRSSSDVEALAQRIDHAFTTSFTLPDHEGGPIEVRVSASVGMAFAGRAEDISDQLVRNADTAMYQAKRKGGAGHQVIDLREASRTAERRELQEDLRAAFVAEQLSVSYQPVVRAADGLVTGVEALLRWTHPGRGAVDPVALVAVAEQTRLINDIGEWVLRRSCDDRARWLERYPNGPAELAVNVSTHQLLAAGFAQTVGDVLAGLDMDPAMLILELTEGIFLGDGPRAMTVLSELKDIGVRLALDDFGTGYSSLSYLRRFPIDIVKIDQSFVADLGLLPTGGAIFAAVTNLAHVLGMCVTAEGVETAGQRDAAVSIGCDSAQGYYYEAALTFAELTDRLDGAAGTRLTLPVVAIV